MIRRYAKKIDGYALRPWAVESEKLKCGTVTWYAGTVWSTVELQACGPAVALRSAFGG